MKNNINTFFRHLSIFWVETFKEKIRNKNRFSFQSQKSLLRFPIRRQKINGDSAVFSLPRLKSKIGEIKITFKVVAEIIFDVKSYIKNTKVFELKHNMEKN